MNIIGIGLEKTGTTTLKRALKELGYLFCDTKDAFFENKYQTRADDITATLIQQQSLHDFETLAAQFEACSDMPWPLLYQQLDTRFPGCKFILTLRDETKWIRSMTNYFGNIHSSVRAGFYGHGAPLGHESQYLSVYRQHIQNVQHYFRDRPNDLLIVDWEKGDAWEVLCNFLNVPAPTTPFPHENKYQNNKNRPKTFVAGTLLLSHNASRHLDALYTHYKRTAGHRLSFVAFPDLNDSGDQAIRRFIAGLQPRKHLAFIQEHIANFDGYCSLLPIPFKRIDAQYPGSKFVFIQSNELALQDTFLGKLKQYVPLLPQWMINRYAAYLRNYERAIQHYFKHRQHDFLSLALDENNTQTLMRFYSL